MVAKPLAHNGHPSNWWPRSVVLNLALESEPLPRSAPPPSLVTASVAVMYPVVECRSCRNLRFPLPCSNHTRFGSVFVMAITVSVQPESYMPGSYMPDTTSRIRFDLVLPKKAPIILSRTGPDPIWMTWSGLGQTHLVKKQAGVQKSTGPVLTERNWPAISFLLSDSVVFFQRRPESYCSKPARIRLVLADCVRFWPNGSGPEASQYTRFIGPASGQRFRANPDRIRHLYWVLRIQTYQRYPLASPV